MQPLYTTCVAPATLNRCDTNTNLTNLCSTYIIFNTNPNSNPNLCSIYADTALDMCSFFPSERAMNRERNARVLRAKSSLSQMRCA